MTRKDTSGAPPKWIGRELVVLVDGPRDGRWYFADDWRNELEAADNMDRAVAYRRTSEHLAHPVWDVAGEVWRHDPAASRAAGLRAGQRGRARAEAAHPEAREVGLDIIHTAARTTAILSADTVRDDMDAADVPMPLRGGLWISAEKAGWIEKIGEQPSGGESAHGKKIAHYRSLLHAVRRSA